MADSGYNEPLHLYRTLFKIARELDKRDELEAIKFLCIGTINRSTLEEIDTPIKLFTELTKMGRITENDFSFLEALLGKEDGIGREDLLTLLSTLNEHNIQYQLPPHQSSPVNHFQQHPDDSSSPPHQRHQSQQPNFAPNQNNAQIRPVPSLPTVPPVAVPPLSSPQHADAPTSPAYQRQQSPQSTSTPGASSPHRAPYHGQLASTLTQHTTVPKVVTTYYQTPPKRLLSHGEVQSAVEGKETTLQEMREQREDAAQMLRNQHHHAPGIPTSPKQFQDPVTAGSLDKTTALTELQQHAHDATDAVDRMKHQQEEIQNEGKMTSVTEMQEQIAQLHLQDTAGSMDKTTSLTEMQQQIQIAQGTAVPAGIHQEAAPNEGNEVYLMEMNRQWEQEHAAALQGTPPHHQSVNNSTNTPTQSSPPLGLDDNVVEDSPSSKQDVTEATSPLEYKTLDNITYHTPSIITSNIGQSPVLSTNKSEDLEVDSPTKPEELEMPHHNSRQQQSNGADTKVTTTANVPCLSQLNTHVMNHSAASPLSRSTDASDDKAGSDAGPAVRPKVRPEGHPQPDGAMGSSSIRQDMMEEKLQEGLEIRKVDLREYQKELARSALQGKNVIITCATGSGKTLVSALTAECAWSEARRKGPPFKALFIVPIRNLTRQQKDQYEMLFQPGIVQEIGDTEELSETLKKRDIVMLTAQIVVNSLKAGTLDLTSLNLLILDECHHTTLDHPYNQIMRYYLVKKDELEMSNPHAALQKTLPQVIGLTASLGVGDSGNALQHLIKLCASLDACRVDHVKENTEELRSHVFTPDSIHILSGQHRKPHDPFSTALDSLMQRVESKAFTDTCPYDRGSQQYESWIVGRKQEAEAKTIRKELIAAQYLFYFNRALRLFWKLRAADAITFLDEKILESPEQLKGPPRLPMDKFCYQQYNEIRDDLVVFAEEEETTFPNPMLQQLRSLLMEKFDEPESYGIVLTQQRRETEAILQYVEEQEVLQGKMRAKRLVGQGKREDLAFTDSKQMAVLKSFRKGLKSEDGCNLLVATDVAQEGLDMPKCNFVIRYDFVSNEIGSVQARGRARAKDAECYLLVTAGSTNERRELENQEKEKFMVEALHEMDKISREDFETRVKAEQVRQLEEWKTKQKNKSIRRSTCEARDVQVYCRQCSCSVCDGTQIIHKGSNYICREPSLPESCEVKYKTPQVYRTTDNIGVVFCGSLTCRNQYGPIIRYKKGQEEIAYGMNVKSFLFDCGDGELRSISKWSKAPFPITEEPDA